MTTDSLKSFHYLENGVVDFSSFETITSTNKLSPGSYKINYLDYPLNRVELKVDTDEETVKSLNFNHKATLDNLFTEFFKPTILQKVNSLGFYHKVGILLYGKEGCGKSTLLKSYYTTAITKHDALVFHMICTNSQITKCWEFIMNIRKIQENPIIVIFEEFDEQIENRNTNFIKTVLDGKMSINNCIFLATTNELDMIPDAMKKRTSRFKYVLDITGIQDSKDVYQIVSGMLVDSVTSEELIRLSEELKGETLDFIKQFCLDKIMTLETKGSTKVAKIGF